MNPILLPTTLGVLFLSGCVTYDPPPQASVPVPSDVEKWTPISVKSWGTVAWEKTDEALRLLGGREVVPISPSLYQALIEQPGGLFKIRPINTPSGHRLYLIRGRGYGCVGGKLRFNRMTRELSVYLVAYNGEMSLPGMRWAVHDIPIVAALPAKPGRIHKSADIGGDSCHGWTDRE